VAAEAYTSCFVDDSRADYFCDARWRLTPVCRSIADCPPCAVACAPPSPDWPVAVCVSGATWRWSRPSS